MHNNLLYTPSLNFLNFSILYFQTVSSLEYGSIYLSPTVQNNSSFSLPKYQLFKLNQRNSNVERNGEKNLSFFPPALHNFANFELFLILPEKRLLGLPSRCIPLYPPLYPSSFLRTSNQNCLQDCRGKCSGLGLRFPKPHYRLWVLKGWVEPKPFVILP